MAAVTAATSATNSSASASVTTGSFTPASGDLLIAYGAAPGLLPGSDIGSMSDSQGLGWTHITSLGGHVDVGGAVDVLELFIANAFTSAGSMTVTYTPSGASWQSSMVCVLRVSGMSRTGAQNAIRTVGGVSNGSNGPFQTAGTTPSLSLPIEVLTSNPTIGAIINETNPATVTPPSGWTEQFDIGVTGSPVHGMEVVSRDSGFSGLGPVSWGSTSATGYGVTINELDTTAYSPVAEYDAPSTQKIYSPRTVTVYS